MKIVHLKILYACDSRFCHSYMEIIRLVTIECGFAIIINTSFSERPQDHKELALPMCSLGSILVIHLHILSIVYIHSSPRSIIIGLTTFIFFYFNSLFFYRRLSTSAICFLYTSPNQSEPNHRCITTIIALRHYYYCSWSLA